MDRMNSILYCFVITFNYFTSRLNTNLQDLFMKHIILRPLLTLVSLLIISSIIPCFGQKKNNVQSTAQVNGDDGILLKIDIEYAVNKKKILVKDKYIEYTVTNIGTVAYNGTISGKKNAIVFDLTTTDGKVIEKSVSFREVLSPGKSTVIKYFIADVGPKVSCVKVMPSRLDFWLTN